ncbi:MAG: alpha/beta hydrolase, partial [Myxococcota bacterium]
MPLDPQARFVLDQLEAVGMPDFANVDPETARNLTSAGIIPSTEAVAAIDDRTIPGPDGEIPVRIYTPEGTGPFAVLVFFHGGGWVICGLDSHDGICRTLANKVGCVVVSVDYRLAPEHPFPAAPEDCFAATTWVAANAASIGADPDRIAIGGDSAGGNLAAAVALMAREHGGPALCHQMLVYPVTNHSFDTPSYTDNAEGYLLSRNAMRWFWGHYLSSDADGDNPLASVLRVEDLSGLPPAHVVTAEFDPLRDEGEAYASRLRDAGV